MASFRTQSSMATVPRRFSSSSSFEPRPFEPRVCPKCKSSYWNVPKNRKRFCSYEIVNSVENMLLWACLLSGTPIVSDVAFKYLFRKGLCSALGGDMMLRMLIIGIIAECHITSFVETGTFFADSICFVAGAYPNLPCTHVIWKNSARGESDDSKTSPL